MARFDIQEAIELHEKGFSWRRIGRELGVHPFSVQYKLQKYGLTANFSPGGLSKIDRDKVFELRDKGHTHKEIGEILNFSESAIQKILKE